MPAALFSGVLTEKLTSRFRDGAGKGLFSGIGEALSLLFPEARLMQGQSPVKATRGMKHAFQPDKQSGPGCD
jgi:hypothetical protein